MFALVDGNSFFASCEKVFRPDLRNHPVVVLSNNDSFLVARSPEAKALGIADLASFYALKHFLEQENVAIFSSNFPLYGDLSARVMQTLKQFSPNVEVYSIDEMFLEFNGFEHYNLDSYGREIKQTVEKHTGIPVGVGIAPTKVLTKLANRAAKKIPQCQGVAVLDTPNKWQWYQKRTAVTDIWGINKRFGRRLAELNIYTAFELAQASPKRIRKHFNVCIERIVEELNGRSCLTLDELPNPKQQIYRTRSFAQKTVDPGKILEHITLFARRATEKLRQQQSFASTLQVLLYVATHEANINNRIHTIQLPYPTDDTRLVSQYARFLGKQMIVPNVAYAKAGIGLLELTDKNHRQLDMFEPGQSIRTDKLMNALDSINKQFGSHTMHLAGEGIHEKWALRQNFRSPNYTTRWSDIPKVICK